MRERLTAIVREPLVRFLVVGALLFGVDGWRRSRTYALTVPRSAQDAVRADWARRMGRPPSDAEYRAALAREVDRRILVAEGVRHGVSQGDPVVEDRIAEREAFLLAAEQPATSLSEAALRSAYEAHPERYPMAPRVGFQHVFFDETRRGEAGAQAAAAQALSVLQSDAGAVSADPFPFGQEITARPTPALTVDFGEAFADALTAAPIATWSGPVRSRLGWHVVRVTSRSPGGVLPFELVRERVRADLSRSQRERLGAETLRALRARYRVVLEEGP